ncbi:MAG: hypothetical protein RJA57_48 [Bacteroidota bacterium]|jgi:hypothetical protein
MNILFSVLSMCLIVLSSCQSSGLQRDYRHCDSLVIRFGPSLSDSVVRTVATTNRDAIRKLLQFMDGPETEMYKCGYDGDMVFYTQGHQVLSAVFKFSLSDCRHFLYDRKNTARATRMSHEAADFIRSLSEGKDYY